MLIKVKRCNENCNKNTRTHNNILNINAEPYSSINKGEYIMRSEEVQSIAKGYLRIR